MVRDHQKIERRTDLDSRLVPGMHYRCALGITVSRVGRRGQIAIGKRIGRIGRVKVGITPEKLLLLGKCDPRATEAQQGNMRCSPKNIPSLPD